MANRVILIVLLLLGLAIGICGGVEQAGLGRSIYLAAMTGYGPPHDLQRAQAAGFGSLLRACLLTPRCTSFTVWGFTDAHSWVPGWFAGEGAATPLDEAYRPKPAWDAMAEELALGARR